MWHLTAEARKRGDDAHLLIIHESDEEWANAQEELDEQFNRVHFEQIKELLLNNLPIEFHPYVLDGTIITQQIPKKVRAAYLHWQYTRREEFEQVMDRAYENKQQAILYLPEKVQQIFLDSLHDFRILSATYGDDSLTVTFDTSGGFSAKSYVAITLRGIDYEEGTVEPGLFYIYDELQKTTDGIAWRVLFNSDLEWTIGAREWDATFYFRPTAYYDFHETGDFAGYVQTLDGANGLHWVSPQLTSEILSTVPFRLAAGELRVTDGVYIDDVRVADTLGTCIDYIHSEVYEDPHAEFAEPVDEADLKIFALGTDLENKVRAWNTMYANPYELQDTINAILLVLNTEQEDDMLQYAYVNHFYREGILTTTVKAKFTHIIE